MGQQVEDVTTHPALAGCARSVAAVYDLQHDPIHQDLLTMPSPTRGQADLNHPEIGPHLHRYVVGKDHGGPEYFRMLKLAWEYACDAFGARQLLFEMYNVSSLATNRQRLASAYDTSPFVALAKELAGITGPVGPRGG